MMQDSFIAPSINIENIVDEAHGVSINQITLDKKLMFTYSIEELKAQLSL